ncbi:MAG TPA: hypothetical protein VK133_01240, partial [Amoebophilaceae bacterium]|nr:hypothetical protein [Amoebophilaceae bacterium]
YNYLIVSCLLNRTLFGYCLTLFDYQFQKFNRCAFFQKYHPLILQIIFLFNNPIGAEYGIEG